MFISGKNSKGEVNDGRGAVRNWDKQAGCHNKGPLWHLTGVNSLNNTALLWSLINSHMVNGSVLHNSAHTHTQPGRSFEESLRKQRITCFLVLQRKKRPFLTPAEGEWLSLVEFPSPLLNYCVRSWIFQTYAFPLCHWSSELRETSSYAY